jgi:alpha-tubulin suppressor-like RCC1 family protein
MLAASCATSLLACSLLVDTSGLSGGADDVRTGDGGSEGGGDDGGGGIPPGEGGAGSVSLLAAGGDHTCAVVRGALYCWGRNDNGQLGDGTTDDRHKPRAVVGLPAGAITALSAGDDHTCAVVGGDAWCWGTTDNGDLGPSASGSTVTKPIKVDGLPKGAVTDVSCGDRLTCALASGQAWCWGRNDKGQLGTGASATESNTPGQVIADSGAMPELSHVSAGNDHACALTKAGDAMCWGHNDNGTLGNQSAGGQSAKALPVQALPHGVQSGDIVGWHACVLYGNGSVMCWGTGDNGELGDDSGLSSTLPVHAKGLDANVTALGLAGGSSDRDATCAIQSGNVLCWGNGQFGRLGPGPQTDKRAPAPIDISAKAVKVAGGFDHFCALTDAGALRCWGKGTSGQLGDGNATNGGSPVSVVGL